MEERGRTEEKGRMKNEQGTGEQTDKTRKNEEGRKGGRTGEREEGGRGCERGAKSKSVEWNGRNGKGAEQQPQHEEEEERGWGACSMAWPRGRGGKVRERSCAVWGRRGEGWAGLGWRRYKIKKGGERKQKQKEKNE